MFISKDFSKAANDHERRLWFVRRPVLRAGGYGSAEVCSRGEG
jgi:hypothetical protein